MPNYNVIILNKIYKNKVNLTIKFYATDLNVINFNENKVFCLN